MMRLAQPLMYKGLGVSFRALPHPGIRHMVVPEQCLSELCRVVRVVAGCRTIVYRLVAEARAPQYAELVPCLSPCGWPH